MRTIDILDQVAHERRRQEELFPEQHLPSGSSRDTWGADEIAAKAVVNNKAKYGGLTWCDVIYEEVCEAFAEEVPAKKRIELLQIAALCVREIEDIDRAGT